jgi:hypothetical protein
MECRVLYPFAQTSTPILIENTIDIKDILEIEYFTKRYMREYGIDNVRGGKYRELKLSRTVEENIRSELDFDITLLENELYIIDRILNRYRGQEWNNPDDLNDEYNRIDKRLSYLYEIRRKIKSIQYYTNSMSGLSEFDYSDYTNYIDFIKESNYIIDHKLTDELEWIKNKIDDWRLLYTKKSCIEDVSVFQRNQVKYEYIMIKISILLNIYNNSIDPTAGSSIKITNTTFNHFFYYDLSAISPSPEEIADISEYSRSIIDELIHIVQFTINRIDEYEFDNREFTQHRENEMLYSMKIIDMIISSPPP